jgi:hypothetical protein
MDQKPDLEQDLKNNEKIRSRVDLEDCYAQNLYAAMCNMRWQKSEIFEILRGDTWSASWRGAGRVISELRSRGNYMDWYCSGMIRDYDNDRIPGYVAEGTVTPEILQDLRDMGWYPVPYNDHND